MTRTNHQDRFRARQVPAACWVATHRGHVHALLERQRIDAMPEFVPAHVKRHAKTQLDDAALMGAGIGLVLLLIVTVLVLLLDPLASSNPVVHGMVGR